MQRLYSFASSLGTFYICASAHRYYAVLEDTLVDFYSSPEKVAFAVALQFNLPLVAGGDIGQLIPADLGEWQKCK